MRSRLDVGKVNAALTEVQKLVTSKYSLLGLSTVPPAVRECHSCHASTTSMVGALM